MTLIGKREQRVDALGKVTGAAKFADDYNRPHQLYGAVKYARFPHARIISIDTSRARSFPGVQAVLTAADVPGKNRFGLDADIRILADDRTRYLGDAVAIVAANSRGLAQQAVDLIDVEYEELPAVFDPEEALQPGAPLIHSQGNQIVHHKLRRGNPEEGFSKADFFLEKKFTTQAIEHAYIEPEAALAEPDEQDGIRVIGCMQNFYTSHKALAAALNLPLARVQIVQSTMGGSFGGKDESMTMLAARAALLAQKTGRPVKLLNSREDSIRQSYKRHAYTLYYKWGCKNDGSITAMQIKAVADGGAYTAMSPFVTWRSVVQATGPYHCENVKTDIYAAFTNNNFTGAMRGFGSPQVNFAIESMMDEFAEKTGYSPLQIRLMNGFQNGSVTASGQKLNHEVSLKQALETVAGKSGFEQKWRSKRKAETKNNNIRGGIGLSCAYRGVALGAEGVDAASAVVYVQPDGSVNVSAGIIDMGQGAQTAMAQIVAEVLGISLSRIRFLIPDTTRVADSGPTVASRGTIMGGGAAKIAAENVRLILEKTACEHFKLEQAILTFRENKVYQQPQNQVLIEFDELVAKCYASGRPLFASGVRHIAETFWDEEQGQGDAYFTYVYGANVAEVEVDMATGKVNVLQFWSAHDVGKAINKAMVEGQIFGGVTQGLGYGLLEEFIQEEGEAKTLNFDEYYIPTALDVPKMEALIIENPDAKGPFGAKSIGEPALEMAAPAIANAIFNATGKRVYNLPANLEEVLLGKKLQRKTPRASVSCKIGPISGGNS